MQIPIGNTRKETSGELLLKKAYGSSYSDFGNAFQTQMKQILDESNQKYAAGRQMGSFDNKMDPGPLQHNVSNSAGNAESISAQNRSYKTRDAADRQRNGDVQPSAGNDGGNSSIALSRMTASNYDADKQRPEEHSTQRDNSDQSSAASMDSSTPSDIRSNQCNQESSAGSREQKLDISKQGNTKASYSRSKTETAQESSDKSNSTETGSASEQQNQVIVDMPQSSAETNTQGSSDAKAILNVATAMSGIKAVEGAANLYLPATGESPGKETVGDAKGSDMEAAGTVAVLGESAAATIAGFQINPAADSKAKESGVTTRATVDVPAGTMAGLQIDPGAESKATESEATVDISAETMAGLQMCPAAESKTMESGAMAPAAVNAALVSRKSLPVDSGATNESTGKISITNGDTIPQSPIHAESNSAPKKINEASASQTFTDVLKQNQAEVTYSLKAGEDSSDSRLGQNTVNDLLGNQTLLSNELLLRVTQQNHQENVLPDANVKAQKIEYRLDNALLSGSNFKNVSLTESTVGNLTQQVSTAQPKEFVLQVADGIQVLVRNGKGEIRVQLKPENLGQMEIRAENTSNGVVAKITTASRDAGNLLEANMHLLQQALKDQGLKIDRINIVVQNGLDASGSSGYNTQSGNTGSESNEQATQSFSKNDTAQSESQAEETASDLTSRMMLNPNIRFHTIA